MPSRQRREFRVNRSGHPGSSRVWEYESQDGGIQAQLPNPQSPTLPARDLSSAFGDVENQAAGLTSTRANLNVAARDGAIMSRQDYSPSRHAPRRGSLSLAESDGEPGETQAASYGDVEDTTPRRTTLIKMENTQLRQLWKLPKKLPASEKCVFGGFRPKSSS
jgi:hypothetical protein